MATRGAPRGDRLERVAAWCSESAPVEYAFGGVANGEVLTVGNVSLGVMHFPGHKPEHIGLVVTDWTRSNRPWRALPDTP